MPETTERRGRRGRRAAEETEAEKAAVEASEYDEALAAHLAALPPVAEGNLRAIVTVAGLSVPDLGRPGLTKVVRHGGVFDGAEDFVKHMVKLGRCEVV